MKIYTGIISFFIFSIISAQKIWSFNDCLSYAREQNLQVIASRLNEQVQGGNYKIAKKQKLPDLTGTIGNNFTAGPQRNGLTSSSYEYTTGYNNSLALNSSILLYNNGSLKIAEEKNSLLLQQYQFTTEKIKNDISLQLVGNYLTVLLNQELLIVNKNSMDTYQQQADRNQKLYNAGSIPLSTLYESNANLANGKQLYETSKIEIDRSLMILAMLLQKDYDDFQIENVRISDNIEIPLINVNDVVQFAYGNQPEIKSSELGIEASGKDIDLAKTALFPTVTGGYGVNTNYSHSFNNDYAKSLTSKSLTDQWYDNHLQTLSLGVSVPIFNKGISKLKVEQSKINQQIQENQLDQQKLTLKQSIQSAYFDVTSSYQTFLSTKESVSSTQLSYEYAQKSFNAGKLSVYDLNIARNSYFNALSQMLQAKYSYLFKLKILDFYAGKPLQISSDVDGKGEVNSIISESSTQYNQFIESSKETIKSEGNTIPLKSDSENVIFAPSESISTSKEESKTKLVADDDISSTIEEIIEPKEQQKTTIPEPKKEEIQKSVDTVVIAPDPKIEIEKNTPKPEEISRKSINDEDAKREALIKERRLKLSEGSSSVNNEAEREALIMERRLKLSKGLE